MEVTPAIKTAMQTTNDRFCNEAIAQRKTEAFDRVYTADAKILPPGVPMITGLEHIKSFWIQAIDGLGLVGAKLTTLEVDICGEGAVEIGEAELHLKTGEPAKAKYIVHWKPQNGEWLWDKDIWNM